jgi:hypothetical protein
MRLCTSSTGVNPSLSTADCPEGVWDVEYFAELTPIPPVAGDGGVGNIERLCLAISTIRRLIQERRRQLRGKCYLALIGSLSRSGATTIQCDDRLYLASDVDLLCVHDRERPDLGPVLRAVDAVVESIGILTLPSSGSHVKYVGTHEPMYTEECLFMRDALHGMERDPEGREQWMVALDAVTRSGMEAAARTVSFDEACSLLWGVVQFLKYIGASEREEVDAVYHLAKRMCSTPTRGDQDARRCRVRCFGFEQIREYARGKYGSLDSLVTLDAPNADVTRLISSIGDVVRARGRTGCNWTRSKSEMFLILRQIAELRFPTSMLATYIDGCLTPAG